MKKLYIVGAIVFVLSALALLCFGQWEMVESTTQENYRGSVVKTSPRGASRVQLTLLSENGDFQNVVVAKNPTLFPFKVIENRKLGDADNDSFSCDTLILEQSVWSNLPAISEDSENCQLQTSDVSQYAWR